MGSFDLAEDALQDAFEATLSQWPAKGPPQNPAAWLITAARHKAIDRIRHRAIAEGKRGEIAALAAVHARAPSADRTDWPQIAALYSLLSNIDPSPVVELNRAVAVAMADGIEQGLALLDRIHLPGYHLLPAVRADLLRRLGRNAEAAAAYRQALALVTNEAERRFLERRLAEVARPPA